MAQELDTTPMVIPANSAAWFVCRAGRGKKQVVADVELRLPARTKVASEAELADEGRMRAARRFKKEQGLHPCTKVEVEFQGVVVADTGDEVEWAAVRPATTDEIAADKVQRDERDGMSFGQARAADLRERMARLASGLSMVAA